MKSKFKIGQELFFMEYKAPKKRVVKGISFLTGDCEKFFQSVSPEATDVVVMYHFDKYTVVDENNVFKTKEELQEDVFKNLD